ncbi:flavodoxin FldA [Blastochloris viridis]|uniref:Flavodoxin n=1 Tax=Blastochloris viridis TaxID=1079 RepID=A0A0H5BD83_BLAVI|nr:flavodoxin FldA [Blastochloris viridis]ALK09915.1 Flavodoxin [Blastochloris viridis]BAS00178.1 flavodoxin 1 [Blastochloris viridis]CUU42578.1 Flavodoxin [Blastochloris viridis]
MSVNVIFGSDGGATKAVASRIAKHTHGRAIDIKSATAADFENCTLLILGAPTYGAGDLQVDWEANIDKLAKASLAGKKVALFGTGDQIGYPESFVDAMGILYEHVVERGAIVVGFTDTAGYDYTASKAERDGRFVGLALDQDTQSSKTEKRITEWVSRLV